MRVGTELKQARERLGLSAQHIAERTKIQLHKIAALESGDFSPLPEGIYLDGIVRAYAQEVAIDPEPLIERVRHERAQSDIEMHVESDDLDGFPVEGELPADVPQRTLPNIPAPIVVASPRPAMPEEDGVRDRIHDGTDRPQQDDLRGHPNPITPAAPIPDLIHDDFEPVEPPSRPIATRPARRNAGVLVLGLLFLLAVAGWTVYQREAHLRPQTSTTVDIGTTSPPSSGSSRVVAPDGSPAPAAPSERTPAAVDGTRSTPEDNPKATVVPPVAATPKMSRNRPAGRASVGQSTTDAAVPAESAGTAASIKDVSGSWTLATRVETSSYARFQGLQLGYELNLQQVGDRVKGAGKKVVENGDGIGSRAQTPISVAGTIEGDRLTLTFNEIGARRPTQGKFVLMLDEADTLRGRFSSTAAHSSGTVEAHRLRR
jgi:cytoskeletal protein RodZ